MIWIGLITRCGKSMLITQVYAEKSGMAHDIKARNLRNLMLYLLAHGKMTKLDLLQRSGLSTTTVSDLINNLLRLGVVETAGAQKSTGGRQPALYRINNEFGVFLGITVEPDSLHMVVSDMYARPLHRDAMQVVKGQNLLYALYDIIDRAKSAAPDLPLLAIGLGLSGRICFRRGIVLESPALGWQNVPIKEILERRFGSQTFVDSATHQAALYQQVLGCAQSLEAALCYFSRVPDRAALILEGRICRGEDNACLTLADGPSKEMLPRMMRMLGIATAVTDVPGLFEGVRVLSLAPDETYFEASAALSAEVLWFEQLYAMHALQTRVDTEGTEDAEGGTP